MGKDFLQLIRGIYDLSSSLLSTIYDAAFRATILEAKTVCYNIQCSAVWPLHSASAELTQQSSQNTTADLSVFQLYLLPLTYQLVITVLTKGATTILNESSILIEGVLMCCNMSTMQTLQITVLQWSEPKTQCILLKKSVKKCMIIKCFHQCIK